ncbi:cupin domain-containing protein [Isoptericola sp. F-RaC21]|uniref:cupin domain-containing protein n=1 Tax=Isoptericola sp. F-RaC21 TaxID=3141452 RepID=UPI00315C4237
MPTQTPLLLADLDGEHLHYDGGLLTFKATGKQTDGAMLLFEARMPRGKATPLHVHPDADETFKILDGRIRIHVDGVDDQDLSAGTVSLVPRGTSHAFMVESEWAHILVILTPASAVSEEFFRLAGTPAADPGDTPPPPDPDRFAAAVATAGLQVLGPPPFAAHTDSAAVVANDH